MAGLPTGVVVSVKNHTGCVVVCCWPAGAVPAVIQDRAGHACLLVLPSDKPSNRREATAVEELLAVLLQVCVAAVAAVCGTCLCGSIAIVVDLLCHCKVLLLTCADVSIYADRRVVAACCFRPGIAPASDSRQFHVLYHSHGLQDPSTALTKACQWRAATLGALCAESLGVVAEAVKRQGSESCWQFRQLTRNLTGGW
jgi:hypothetical protein